MRRSDQTLQFLYNIAPDGISKCSHWWLEIGIPVGNSRGDPFDGLYSLLKDLSNIWTAVPDDWAVVTDNWTVGARQLSGGRGSHSSLRQ